MADIIKTALDFWQKIYDEREATVKFTKLDGTTRYMRFTLDFTKIPKKDHPKKVDLVQIMKKMNDQGIIHVYDLDKMAWRSVPFERAEWVEFNEDRSQPERFKLQIPKRKRK
jgi:hypothetical protein